MPSTVDAATRHQVFVQRYAGGREREAIRALNRLRRNVLVRLAQDPTEFTRGRLRDLLDELDSILQIGFAQIGATIQADNNAFIGSEAAFSAKLFNLRLPADVQLQAAVEGSIIGAIGVKIEDALRDLTTKKIKQLRNIITDGIALGDTQQVIARKVGGIMATLHKRQVATLTRTVINHLSATARDVTFKANGVEQYEWVATLDSHTTLTCGSRDGKLYQVGVGPMPPAHWGCRSTVIPASGATARPNGPGDYGSWLKKQPIAFIDEALGVERSRLFRAGKLPLEKFVDPTGRIYTLAQLESMNPFVFGEK